MRVTALSLAKVRQEYSFSCGHVKVKVDNVGAFLVAGGGTELGGELRLEEGVGGDSDGVAVEATSVDAFIGFDVISHPFNHNLGGPALIFKFAFFRL